MRQRSITTPTAIPAGTYRYWRYAPANPGVILEDLLYTSPIFALNNFDSSETMEDELPYGKFQGYCKHQKSVCQVYPGVYSGQRLAGVPLNYHNYAVAGGYFQYTYFRTRVSILNAISGSSTFEWNKASFFALKTMKPKFSDMSLANSLLELDEIKNIAKPYGKAKSRLGKASSATLWYSFGVKPVLEDIKGIYDLIRSLPAKIRDIKNRGKRLQTRHYARLTESTGINLPTSDAFTVIENGGGFNEVAIRAQYRWISEPEYHATMKFRYDISSLSSLELGIQAWAQALGFDKLLSVAWEAVPFSFVVDWFVNIGEWIDSLQAEPVLPIVIEDFSHSLKYSYQAEAQLRWWGSAGLLVPIASRTVSYYERKRDIPSTVAPWNWKFPSFSQMVLGAALIGQAADAASNRRNKPTRRPPTPRWLNYSRVRSSEIR